MSETEIAEWLKLLAGGGNAAIIVLAMLAIKVANAFLAGLRALRDDGAKQHAELIAGQEEIKRAIVAGNPRAQEIFQNPR